MIFKNYYSYFIVIGVCLAHNFNHSFAITTSSLGEQSHTNKANDPHHVVNKVRRHRALTEDNNHLNDEEVLAFVEDISLRTPKLVEEAFHTYAFAKHRGNIMDAFADADLNNNEELDEHELDQLIFVSLCFFYGGIVDTYADIAALADNYNLVFITKETDSTTGNTSSKSINNSRNRSLQQKEAANEKKATGKTRVSFDFNLFDGASKFKFWSLGVREDPHYTTFKGIKYDYNGLCEFMLLNNPNSFSSIQQDFGLHIQGRTDKFIRPTNQVATALSAVAVRIGAHIMEARNDGSHTFNYQDNKPLPAKMTVDNYPPLQTKFTVYKSSRNKICFGPGRYDRCAKASIFDITTHNYVDSKNDTNYNDVFFSDHVYLNVHRGYVDVVLYLKDKDVHGSVGMMGTYPTSSSYETDMLARDGMTELKDPIDFGREWRKNLDAGDPEIFSGYRPGPCVFG